MELQQALEFLRKAGNADLEPRSYDFSQAVSRLRQSRPDLIEAYLVRLLGSGFDSIKHEAAETLKSQGAQQVVAEVASAIAAWDVEGLRGALGTLNAEQERRLFDICSDSGYYNYHLSGFAKPFQTPRKFVDHIRSSEAVPWAGIEAALRGKRFYEDLSNLLLQHMEIPRSGFVIFPQAAPALVCAYLNNLSHARHLLSLLKATEGAAREATLGALEDEGGLIDEADNGLREYRLLAAALAMPSLRLEGLALGALGSPSGETRAAAAKYLTLNGRRDLIEWLQTTNEARSRSAAPAAARLLLGALRRRLKHQPDAQAISALYEIVGAPALREIAAVAPSSPDARAFLSKIGSKAFPFALAAAREADWNSKQQFGAFLADLADDSMFGSLLRGGDPEFTAAVAQKSAVWSSALDALKMLDSADTRIRSDAATLIGGLPTEIAVSFIPKLVTLLGNKEQKAVLDTLGRLPRASVSLALLDWVGRRDFESDQLAVLDLLAKQVNTAVLNECLSGANSRAQRGALTFLAQRGVPPELAVPIQRLLGDADPKLRIGAVVCLSLLDDPAVCFSLLPVTADADKDVQAAAVSAINALFPGLLLTPSSSLQLTANMVALARAEFARIAGTPMPVSDEVAGLLSAYSKISTLPESVTRLLNALEGVKLRVDSPAHSGFVCSVLQLTIAMAVTRARSGSMAEAIVALERAGTLVIGLGNPNVECRIWELVGVYYEARGDDGGAWEAFRKASDVIDRQWLSFVCEEQLGPEFFKDKADLYDRLVLCALRLGYDAEAFEYSEKSRARYLGDLIARRHRARRRELSPREQDSWGAIDGARLIDSSRAAGQGVSLESPLIAAVSWTGSDPPDTRWRPLWLARWESLQELDRRSSLSPHSVWKIVAWLSDGEQDKGEVPELLKALRDVLSRMLAGERDAALSEFPQYERVALPLAQCNDPRKVGLFIFHEYQGAFRNLLKRLNWNDDALVELKAIHEALDFAQRGLATAVMNSGSRTAGGLAFQVADRVEVGEPAQDSTRAPQVRARFTTTNWAYVTRLARGIPVNFRRVRTEVRGDAELGVVEFHVMHSRTVAFLVHGRGSSGETLQVFSFPELGAPALGAMLLGPTGWVGQLAAWRANQLRDDQWVKAAELTLTALYRALFAPIAERAKELGLQRLLLVPHRCLEVVPFHALFEMRNGERHYVLDAFEIAYAPSCTLAAISAERQESPHRPRNLLASYAGTNSLPLAKPEVNGLARHFPGSPRILADVEATLTNLEKEMPFRSHFHFAGHAHYVSSSPLDSYLELNDGGKLSAGTLFDGALRLARLETAALSACDTGLADPGDPASEYLGLAGAFVFAGAGSVICTLWPALDLSAALLMDRFYLESVGQPTTPGSSSPITALRRAQLWLRDMTVKGLRRHLKSDACSFDDELKRKIDEGCSRMKPNKRLFEDLLAWAPYQISTGFRPASS